MAVIPILEIGDPRLREVADEVAAGDIASDFIQSVIQNLIDTMRSVNGAGLAAPQIGIPLRIFVVEISKNPRYPYLPEIPLTVVVNPVIHPLTKTRCPSFEGCLSVPNFRGRVLRYLKIELRGLDANGGRIKKILSGMSAVAFQHEYDHLDGVLFVDKADPKTLSTEREFQNHHQPDFVETAKMIEARYRSGLKND